MSNFKFTWGHGVMLGLGSFMLFILSLIFLADETGDLISEDYYEESLVFQEHSIDATNREKALRKHPQITKQANGFRVDFPIEVQPDSGQVYMMRGAFKSDDIILGLELNSQHAILIPAAKMKPGEYDLTLTWYSEGLPYLWKETLTWSTP